MSRFPETCFVFFQNNLYHHNSENFPQTDSCWLQNQISSHEIVWQEKFSIESLKSCHGDIVHTADDAKAIIP